MSEIDSSPLKQDLQKVSQGSQDSMQRVAAAAPAFNATLRTTCVATQLEGGHAMNALPQLAAATVHCRVLPEDSVAYGRSALQKVRADDQVALSLVGEPSAGPASPMRPDILKAVTDATPAAWPSVPVVP